MNVQVTIYDNLSMKVVAQYQFDWDDRSQRRIFSEQASNALRARQTVITMREEAYHAE